MNRHTENRQTEKPIAEAHLIALLMEHRGEQGNKTESVN